MIFVKELFTQHYCMCFFLIDNECFDGVVVMQYRIILHEIYSKYFMIYDEVLHMRVMFYHELIVAEWRKYASVN